jgi:hypothetical protein
MALPFALYIVCQQWGSKFNITTINPTNQKAEIINTTLCRVSNIPINASSCLLQVGLTKWPQRSTATYCVNSGYYY